MFNRGCPYIDFIKKPKICEQNSFKYEKILKLFYKKYNHLVKVLDIDHT